MQDNRVREELVVRGPDREYVTIITRFLVRYGWPKGVLVKPKVVYQTQSGQWSCVVDMVSKDSETIEVFKASARNEVRKALRREN